MISKLTKEEVQEVIQLGTMLNPNFSKLFHIENLNPNETIYIYKENNINKLSYLYYECFNTKETNKDKMIENFDYYLEKDFDFLMNKLYKFFKLLQFNK